MPKDWVMVLSETDRFLSCTPVWQESRPNVVCPLFFVMGSTNRWPGAGGQPLYLLQPPPDITDQLPCLGESKRPLHTSTHHCCSPTTIITLPPSSSGASSGAAPNVTRHVGFRAAEHRHASFTSVRVGFHTRCYKGDSQQHSQTLNTRRHFSMKKIVLGESFYIPVFSSAQWE